MGRKTAAASPRGAADLRDALVALNAAPEVGRAPACHLGLAALRHCTLSARADGFGLPGPLAAAARRVVARAAVRAEAERERAHRAGARVVTLLEADYPRPLLDLALPPPVLYVQGEVPPEVAAGAGAVAIVGSRAADAYGREAADHFARALAGAGLCVVSGCARGVDAVAHRGALAAGGTTVAVLGCGIDVDYPRGHAGLRRDIAAAGAVITEFPCGCTPEAWHFPVRNRLIAALALGTLVVQAGERSGSLITARHALDLGREVLAVPGSVFAARAAGPHALLRDGAVPAATPRDVLDALLGPSRAAALELPGAPGSPGGARPGGVRGAVLEALEVGEPRSPEALAAALGEGIDAVLGALLELELEGWARRHPGPGYSRAGRRAGPPTCPG
jgi:DNA processing protein